MTGPGKPSPEAPSPDDTGIDPGDTRGYPEPQPTDKDDARHRGPHPGTDREDGGLERDADGGESSDA